MRVLPGRLGKSQPTFLLLLFLLIVIAAQVSAEPADDKTTDAATDAQTTDDRSTTDSTPSVTDTTASTTESTSSTSTSESTTSTTSTTSESSTTSTTMDSTTSTTSDSSTSTSSTTSDSTTTTSSVSTTTTSTSSTSSSTGAALVTVPPTAGAPYLQTSNTPEGTVFIAVGAILGFIGLAVLAWRGMVAWSVNRSVRRAAMASAKSKHLVRRSQKKRSTAVYSSAPAGDVSLDKLGGAQRASYHKSSRRVPSNSSGLFYSPTAGGGTGGSHHSLNTAPGNRNSSYLPAGFYAAPGTSTPNRESNSHASIPSPTGFPPGSPSLPPVGTYYDPPHASRHSYMAASHSSLNLNQTSGARAPSAYLEDLFENHSSPRNTDPGRR